MDEVSGLSMSCGVCLPLFEKPGRPSERVFDLAISSGIPVELRKDSLPWPGEVSAVRVERRQCVEEGVSDRRAGS